MKYLVAFLLVVLLGFGATLTHTTAAPPVPLGQPHPDQFIIVPYGNLAQYNPMDVKVKSNRAARYRLETASGCTTGTIPSDLQRMGSEALNKLHLSLLRNDSTFDFTIRINCGSEQIRLCGAVTIFCLPYGYPYNVDVSLSDILSTYQETTRLAIPLHEVVGHALATWDEQYCKGGETDGPCKGLAQFTSTPNWHDVMNTGVESRHGLEAIELGRWSRTMYDVLECVGQPDRFGNSWDQCSGRWVNSAGWSYDPATRIWYAPNGVAEWGECRVVDADCWNLRAQEWVFKGSSLFVPVGGYFSSPPLP